jgi:hypothetical protein
VRWARLIYGTDTAQTETEIAHAPAQTPTRKGLGSPENIVVFRDRSIGEFCSSVDKPEEKERGKKVLLQEYPTRPRAERERECGGVVFACVGVWVCGFFCSNVSEC